MAPAKVFGVVVIGVGMAGKVRIRDLLTAADNTSLGLKLVGFVSRRCDVEVEGAERLSMEDAMTRSDVDAVLICSESGAHEEHIRKALDHNKHVLVEYPVALSMPKANEFYTEAKNKGLVIHEENIALLTDDHKKLKAKAQQSRLKNGQYILKGNFNRWLEELNQCGKPFSNCAAEIQSCLDAFGDLKATMATFEKLDDVTRTAYELETTFNSKINFSVERYVANGQRKRWFEFNFEDGETVESAIGAPPSKPNPQKKGLFMQDLFLFAEKMRGERSVDDDVKLSLRSLAITDELNDKVK
ncbi:biliverdin reductase A-like [Gigantopelta aegis]|uniref:biliverdin reductase A-like n=1 Tax=Gigantopelta aegis TaxID=1735272 RepID=UPI001B88D7ED|nr:biliverdin reductase A-like [Gigantopelta aegis]